MEVVSGLGLKVYRCKSGGTSYRWAWLCQPLTEDRAWNGPTSSYGGPGCWFANPWLHTLPLYWQASVETSDWWQANGMQVHSWCLALLQLQKPELAVSMALRLWWGRRATLAAGMLHLPSYRDLSDIRCKSMSPVGVVRGREQGETQVAGVVHVRQALEKSAERLLQLCLPLVLWVVKYA